MKRTGLILTIAFVVVMFFFQHRSTPNVPLPASAKMVGTEVQIPVKMQLPNPTVETWTLATQQFKKFFVNVYNKGQLVTQFESSGSGNEDGSGIDYSTSGKIMFNSYLYQAKSIHVNLDKHSGFINLTPAKATS